MEKNIGIILKNFNPHKQKLSIFDKELGRIEAIVYNSRSSLPLHNGTLFTYYKELQSSFIYRITEIEIIDIPFMIAKHDIYFFHHMLELCYYFLPLHMAFPEIFELLKVAFRQIIDVKAFILLRFFVLLGNYPEDIPLEKKLFLHLLSCPFEIILKEKLDDTQHKMLESWLLRCIEMHPYKKQFKTKYLF